MWDRRLFSRGNASPAFLTGPSWKKRGVIAASQSWLIEVVRLVFLAGTTGPLNISFFFSTTFFFAD
jgi:hypothetical protein